MGDLDPFVDDRAGGARRRHLEREQRGFGHLEREDAADVAQGFGTRWVVQGCSVARDGPPPSTQIGVGR